MVSPNLAQEVAADPLAAGLLVGHDAPAGAEDRDAHSGADPVDAVMTHVHAAAWGRHATDAIDGRLAVAPVAQHHRQGLGLLTLADANVVEVSLGLEHARDVLLETRVRHLGALVPRHGGVADTGEHVRDRIGHHGITSSP